MAGDARGAARRAAPRSETSPSGAERPSGGARSRAGSFRVLGPAELAARARHRRAGRMLALAAAVVVCGLLVVAGAQALVAEQQVRLDGIQQQLDQAVARNQQLTLERASLGAPNRILAIAQGTLKMRAPASVAYLHPVDPGPSVADEAAGTTRPGAHGKAGGAGSTAAGGAGGRSAATKGR